MPAPALENCQLYLFMHKVVKQNILCTIKNYNENITIQTIKKVVNDTTGGIYFLDAPGSTGKTFLISLILATICSHNEIALTFASFGIAATLLEGGRTAPSVLNHH